MEKDNEDDKTLTADVETPLQFLIGLYMRGGGTSDSDRLGGGKPVREIMGERKKEVYDCFGTIKTNHFLRPRELDVGADV